VEDTDVLTGDEIDKAGSWGGKTDLGSLAGKPMHLQFGLRNADLFSFKFED